MKLGVYITKINGDIELISDNDKIKVEKEIKLGVNTRYFVKSEKNSYAYITHNINPESKAVGYFGCLFADSYISVLTGRGYIKEIEVLKGIIYTPGISKVKIPYAEFIESPVSALCFIEVTDLNEVSLFDGRIFVIHEKSRKMVELKENCQIKITEDNIIENEPMQQRYYNVKKTLNELYVFQGVDFYKNIYNKSDKLKETALYVNKIIADKTGEDFEKIKNEIDETFAGQKNWAKQNAEEMEKIRSNILKRNYNIKSENISIDKMLQYSGLDIKISNIKIEESQDNKLLLSILLEIENKTNKEIFVFWNEEVRLINDENKIILIGDYNLDTDFMPGSKKNGYLFTNIEKNDNIGKIQFGKKSLSKVEIDLKIQERG